MDDTDEPAIPQAPADDQTSAALPNAEALSTPETSEPMLDVHAAHETIHTWKDFLIHLTTIVIGLLIAVGLEQTVEYFHHRHQVAEMRKALDVERRINASEFGILTEDFHRVIPILQSNIAVYKYLQLHPGAPPEQWPGRLSWLLL
jgi:hypothetical protein